MPVNLLKHHLLAARQVAARTYRMRRSMDEGGVPDQASNGSNGSNGSGPPGVLRSESMQFSSDESEVERKSMRHGKGSVPPAAAKPQRKGNRLERDLRDEIDAW